MRGIRPWRLWQLGLAGLLALACASAPGGLGDRVDPAAAADACATSRDELARWTVERLHQPQLHAAGVSVLDADDLAQALAALPAPRGRAGYAIGLVRTDRGTRAKFRFRLVPSSTGARPRLELIDVFVVEGGVFRPTYTRLFELDLREGFDFDALMALDDPGPGPADLRFDAAPRLPRIEAPAGAQLFFPTGSICGPAHARR